MNIISTEKEFSDNEEIVVQEEQRTHSTTKPL